MGAGAQNAGVWFFGAFADEVFLWHAGTGADNAEGRDEDLAGGEGVTVDHLTDVERKGEE